MTLLVSWIGVDDKKDGKSIASLYIASDSKYSWGKKDDYEYGVKVFGSASSPDIFGFCGDVLFPSIVLGQIIPQIDSGVLYDSSDNGNVKNEILLKYIQTSLKDYPKEQMAGTFTILHGTRSGTNFQCFKTTYSQRNGLENKEIELPRKSTKICSAGSGKNEFDENYLKWESEKHNNYRTSRGVFHCLNETLINIKDKQTGGKPQIVGLYRIKNCRLFGIVDNGKKYIYGKESSADINSKRIEWRNENFERINPETLELLEGAQRQPL